MPFKSKREAKAYSTKYAKTHKKQAKGYRTAIVERIAVRSHYYNIFRPKSHYHKYYKNMPFYDAWNPDKGGSFYAAETWIIENIGNRPEGTSLHVVDHSLGFVPGNLEWTHPKRQAHQQMHKIIAQQRNRIRKLEVRIKELEGRA